MDEAFNASLIVGIATLTMVLSITTSSTARHRAVRASPLFPDRACLRTGMGVGINERSDCISMFSYCVTMLSTNETILLSVGRGIATIRQRGMEALRVRTDPPSAP